MPASTFARNLHRHTEQLRNSLIESIASEPVLHWVDNFDKIYPANSIYLNSQMYRSMRWTAHGIKKLPGSVSLNWCSTADAVPIPALPPLRDLLSENLVNTCLLNLRLRKLYYSHSLAVSRNVRRIPLKPPAFDADELDHLDQSSDGLRYFEPLDIYPRTL
jgi:hypothetical protein